MIKKSGVNRHVEEAWKRTTTPIQYAHIHTPEKRKRWQSLLMNAWRWAVYKWTISTQKSRMVITLLLCWEKDNSILRIHIHASSSRNYPRKCIYLQTLTESFVSTFCILLLSLTGGHISFNLQTTKNIAEQAKIFANVRMFVYKNKNNA